MLIKSILQSDHTTVILKLKFVEFERGKMLWENNNPLFKDMECIKLIIGAIHKVKQNTQHQCIITDISNEPMMVKLQKILYKTL